MGGSQGFQASRGERSEDGPSRGSHDARPGDPIAVETVQRRHAPETARPVAIFIAVTSVRRMGVAAGGDLGALRCQYRGADTSVRDDSRQSALAMSIGTAAECVGAASRAAVLGADAAQLTGLSRMRVGSGGSKRGERFDRRDG
jgi:hypothetical protein